MSHLSVVELENELGPRLFAAEHGGAPAVMFAGRYQLSWIRGHGARGLVVKARDVRLERVVALKLYPYPESAALSREVEVEAKAAARLDHPNVVRVIDVGHADLQLDEQGIPCLFISMAYIDGTSARTWLGGGPPRGEILRVFLAAAEGLAAAHEEGIVHRDIKPENIVVDPKVGAKIVDFGLARARGGAAEPERAERQTDFGVIKGTFEYMAPEARRGRADPQSDQFSFAVALWEALTGALPFDPSRGEWRLGHERDFVGAERLPPELAEPLRRALEYRAEDRFTSMRELIAALRRGEEIAGLSGPSRPTLAPLREPAPPAARSRWLFALPILAAVAYGGYAWLAAGIPAVAAKAEPSEASPTVAAPRAPDCAAAPFAGRWRFNTRVLWGDDSKWIGVEGFYWLTVEVGDDCAAQGTFERFGDSGNRKYKTPQQARTTLTLEREPAGAVWLAGEISLAGKDTRHAYHLAIAGDGGLVGDWSFRERSDRPTMTGILRGTRGEVAGHVPSDLSDSPCVSSCRIRCAGAAAVDACVTSACVVEATASTDTCPPDPDAPPPILAQDLINTLREEKPVAVEPHTKCQDYGRYLDGRWTVWQDREPFTLDLTVDGCELRGRIRAKNGSLAYTAAGHVTVGGQWYLRPLEGVDAPLWALSGRDPAFGLTSTYPRAALAAHKAR